VSIETDNVLNPTQYTDPRWSGVYTGNVLATVGYIVPREDPQSKELGKVYAVYQPSAVPLTFVRNMGDAEAVALALYNTVRNYAIEGPIAANEPEIERCISLLRPLPAGQVRRFMPSLHETVMGGAGQTVRESALENLLTQNFSARRFP